MIVFWDATRRKFVQRDIAQDTKSAATWKHCDVFGAALRPPKRAGFYQAPMVSRISGLVLTSWWFHWFQLWIPAIG
ncbi:hypothetical protein GCM10028828_19150 [Corynebacterium tapiri]